MVARETFFMQGQSKACASFLSLLPAFIWKVQSKPALGPKKPSLRVAACIISGTGCDLGWWRWTNTKGELQGECAIGVNFMCLFIKCLGWSEEHWRYDADIPWPYYPYFWTLKEELCETRAAGVAVFLCAHRCTACSSCDTALCGV